MSRSRSVLCIVYVALAVVALITCWRQNLQFADAEGIGIAQALVEFWPALLANHATTSITLDIFLLGTAVIVWMIVEARRLGIRFVWLYVLLSFPIAISVMVPLFLVARERRLHELGDPRSTAELGPLDIAGLVALGAPIVVGALWTLVW